MRKKLLCLMIVAAMMLSLLPAAKAEDIVIVDPEDEELITVIDSEKTTPEDSESRRVIVVDPSGEVSWQERRPADQKRVPNLSVSASGACGDNLTWTLEGGVMTVSGTGPMWNYWNETQEWLDYREDIKKLVVNEGVTTIGVNAFLECSNLASASLPDSLKEIRIYAFDSSGLKSITIPKNVTNIGWGAFRVNSSLTSIQVAEENTAYQSVDGVLLTKNGALLHTFPAGKQAGAYSVPAGVSELEIHSLESCYGLTSVELPASLNSIKLAVFFESSNISRVRFLGSAPSISENTFYGVTAVVEYPDGDASWTESIRKNYGGDLTWKAYIPGPNVTIQGISTKGVALGWPTYDGAEKYEVQRKQYGGEWAPLKSMKSNAYTDSSAQMGVSYSYRVLAYANGKWTGAGMADSVLFNPFTDVPSSGKTLEYVSWAYNNGIVAGTSDTTFKPDNSCTRIQFVMMLWKMHGSPVVPGTNPFSDISGTKTTNAILWALNRGVINSGSKFNPDDNISRVNIVMILWKLAGSPKVSGDNPFTDVSGTKTINAVLWAYQNSITKGTSATTFAPDKDCTRVQLVIFLYKYNNIYHVI